MKKTLLLKGLVFCAGLGLASCADQLDADKYFKDRMTLEEVFTDLDYTEQWLNDAFSHLVGHNADVASKGHTPFCFADDMYYGDREDQYRYWKNGEYNENDFKQESWAECYQGIRQASIFIQNIDMNMEMTAEQRADYKAQARFVRAYYYWLLLRKYGPVPILPDEGLDYTLEYDELAIARSSYDECAEFIASEMQEAARDLPLTRSQLYVARPTRGAALATRAKALLYAASPINNPRPTDTERFTDLVNFDGKHLISQEYDNSKWARAAAAALDVINLNQYELYVTGVTPPEGAQLGYPATVTPPADGDFSEHNWPEGWKDIDPYASYRELFNGTVSATDNPELIFTRGQNQSSEGIDVMVVHQLPRVANGWNTHGITQKQCDAYYMNDGTDCPGKDYELVGRGDGSKRLTGFVTKEESDAHVYPELGDKAEGVSYQYVRREPRFYASVAYNGSTWYLLNETDPNRQNQQVFYYRAAGNGYTNTMFWLRTGIGVMKFVHPKDTYTGGDLNLVTKKAEPAIRYADILLMYAEALNEVEGNYDIPSWDGATSYPISRDVNEIKRGVRPVRCRAGLPDYTSAEYGDQDALRAKLKRERQIELMGEGQRYYDLRRWKDAEVEESLPIYGCNTLMNAAQRELFHTPVEVPSLPTNFSRKMYFWPIQHSELKRNKLLTQNPGWTYND